MNADRSYYKNQNKKHGKLHITMFLLLQNILKNTSDYTDALLLHDRDHDDVNIIDHYRLVYH